MNKFLIAVMLFALTQTGYAQQKNVLTAKDYERAENTMAAFVDPLINHNGIHPTWLADDRFYYRTSLTDGNQFILFDPVKRTRVIAFNHEKLAAALSAATGKQYTSSSLPFQTISFSANGNDVIFNADDKQWKFNTKTNRYRCNIRLRVSINNIVSLRRKTGGMGAGCRG